MTATPRRGRRWRGGPLVMLAVVLTGWSAARAVWWENPFAPLAASLDLPLALPLAKADTAPASGIGEETAGAEPTFGLPAFAGTGTGTGTGTGAMPLLFAAGAWQTAPSRALTGDPRQAAAHRHLWVAALRDPLARGLIPAETSDAQGWSAVPPFLPDPSRLSPARRAATPGGGRWSVDAWAFWRQGSDAAPVSEGRVPIYGASQAGAVLQYRLAPGSSRDPRLYARAYRALVRRGESEIAAGASARPLAGVPLRAAAELRYTDAAFDNAWRPAAYVVTEIAPAELPFGVRAEVYGQAGWVGGPDPTGFADGQASLTGQIGPVADLTGHALRLSVGAGAWGGAQKDAQRIDVGPTLRLDVTLGEVPARFSVDWRQRVAGDASPGSGVAATLSTGF